MTEIHPHEAGVISRYLAAREYAEHTARSTDGATSELREATQAVNAAWRELLPHVKARVPAVVWTQLRAAQETYEALDREQRETWRQRPRPSVAVMEAIGERLSFARAALETAEHVLSGARLQALSLLVEEHERGKVAA